MFTQLIWTPTIALLKKKKIKPDLFHYHVSTSKIIETGVLSVFENKHKWLAYFCFIAPLERLWMPVWLTEFVTPEIRVVFNLI